MTGREPLDLLHHALIAAARFPVIPLAPGQKVPDLVGWQRRASRDRRVLRRWWAAKPDRNIGVCTGRGLLVVDLDVAGHGSGEGAGERDGLAELESLARRHGDDQLWDTYTVETPSGGQHLYFRCEDRACARNTQQLLGRRVDTRGAGGFIVGAGSVRADRRPYRVLVARPVAPIPGWLADALRPPAPPPPAPRVELSSTDGLRRYVQRAVRDECDAVASATPGGRNAALLRAARILGEFVGAQALTETDAVSALLQASAVHVGVAGFSAQEAARTVHSGLGYGQQRPRDLGTARAASRPRRPPGSRSPASGRSAR